MADWFRITTAKHNKKKTPLLTNFSCFGILKSDITGSMADTLGTLNPFRYRGYIYDEETALYYCRSRYYDPEIGRFLNGDKYASTGQGPLGHNMFAYCINNPVNMIDATGECPRYYDEFTCPICNRWRVANGYGYPTYENNPNVITTNNGYFTYYRAETITYKYQLTSDSARSTAQDINTRNDFSDFVKTFLITTPVTVATLVIPEIPMAVSVALTIGDVGVGFASVFANDNIGVEWYYPYYKYVEVYVNAKDPRDKKVVVSIISQNENSDLHKDRHVAAYDPYNKYIAIFAKPAKIAGIIVAILFLCVSVYCILSLN